MSSVGTLLNKVDALAKALRGTKGKQVWSTNILDQMRTVAGEYFVSVHPIAEQSVSGGGLAYTFQELHSSSRGHPSTQKCLELLKAARRDLVELEGQSLTRPKQLSVANPADELIVSTLNDICPSAALAYQQALRDLAQTDRLSWRGPATDLREALRETLDLLAPDDDVSAMSGFKLEPDAKRPTMKQKVRFVLRSRGIASGAMSTPETAVNSVEEIVGGLTRSVYTRSSVSTHTATLKPEVVRVHAWVRLVLCELLELPL